MARWFSRASWPCSSPHRRWWRAAATMPHVPRPPRRSPASRRPLPCRRHALTRRPPGALPTPRQAGPAADGGGEERRRRPGRRHRLPRRRHLHRQLDGPVDACDGPLADIADSAGPLPLAVSVDEEGGRVSRLKSLIGAGAVGQGAGADPDRPIRSTTWRSSAASKMHDLGITIDFAPVVDVTDAPDDTRDRGPLVRLAIRKRSPPMPGRTRRVCGTPGCCRCSSTSPVTGTAPATRTTAASSRRR